MLGSSTLVICVSNDGAEDLQVMKVYRRLPDDIAGRHDLVRVVDDSGEDYLYPRALFLGLPLPSALKERLEGLASAADQRK
jgi:hypothetical protein